MDQKCTEKPQKTKVELMLRILTICTKTVLLLGGISLLYRIITDGMKKDGEMRDVTPRESKIPVFEIVHKIKKTPALLCNFLNYIPYSVKLLYIKNQLSSSNPIYNEAGALLLAATFEHFIISLYRCRMQFLEKKEQKNQQDGIVMIGKELRNLNLASREEYDLIKDFAKEIRNPVVHGDFRFEHIHKIKVFLPKIEGMITKYGEFIDQRKDA